MQLRFEMCKKDFNGFWVKFAWSRSRLKVVKKKLHKGVKKINEIPASITVV